MIEDDIHILEMKLSELLGMLEEKGILTEEDRELIDLYDR